MDQPTNDPAELSFEAALKRLEEIVPDSTVFPYASGRADPREDFRTELTLFADSLFREDRSVVELLKASHTYLNERVALHYGITDVKGDRSKAPHEQVDPDLFVHVVERRPDGVVIRGAYEIGEISR